MNTNYQNDIDEDFIDDEDIAVDYDTLNPPDEFFTNPSSGKSASIIPQRDEVQSTLKQVEITQQQFQKTSNPTISRKPVNVFDEVRISESKEVNFEDYVSSGLSIGKSPFEDSIKAIIYDYLRFYVKTKSIYVVTSYNEPKAFESFENALGLGSDKRLRYKDGRLVPFESDEVYGKFYMCNKYKNVVFHRYNTEINDVEEETYAIWFTF